MNERIENAEWNKSDTEVFWGEIAPCNHVVQIYESDEVILDSLEGFVTSGIAAGESVIIIATQEHIRALNGRLIKHGLDLDELRKNDQYCYVDAEETLASFMVKNWPDDALFMEMVKSVVGRARGKNNRKVRAYGEMVAILWAKGFNGATVHLEHLWNQFCESEIFCLFCAYPKSGFTQDVNESIAHICSSHTKLLAGDRKSVTQVFYKKAE